MKPWLIGLLALLYFNAPALAQETLSCGPLAKIIDGVTKHFEEVAVFEMTLLADGRFPVRFFANPKTGTWSAVVLQPDGTVCIAMSGYNIKALKIPTPGDPA